MLECLLVHACPCMQLFEEFSDQSELSPTHPRTHMLAGFDRVPLPEVIDVVLKDMAYQVQGIPPCCGARYDMKGQVQGIPLAGMTYGGSGSGAMEHD